jgi:hypothetical protein
MATRVIIPWRRGCPYREAALSRVVLWWEGAYPGWTLTIGEYPGESGGWRKSMAIAAAGSFADDDIVIVSDADVVCEQVELGVEALRRAHPRYLWAMPHRAVYRLTEHATRQAVDGSWWPSHAATQRQLQPYLSRSYAAYSGGGIVILPGRILREVPMDPRFVGWGQEEHSWSLALSMLAGAPWRGHGSLWHLWHPPAPRLMPGIGSRDSIALWHRYRTARTPQAMRSLVAEARSALDALESSTAR